MYQPAAQTLKWTGVTSEDETIKKMALHQELHAWSLVKYRPMSFIKSIDTSLVSWKRRPLRIVLPARCWGRVPHQRPADRAGYQISTSKYSGATTRSEVVETKKYNNWTHFRRSDYSIAGRRRHRASTSSTYSIHADKPARNQLPAGKESMPSPLRAARMLTLVGNIASAGSGGTVTLASKQGSIEAQTGAVINTDNLTVSALVFPESQCTG